MKYSVLKEFRNAPQQNNELKSLIQRYLIKDWIVNHNCKSVIPCYTGFGKTFIAKTVIERLAIAAVKNNQIPPLPINITVVVPSLNLQTQWNTKIESLQNDYPFLNIFVVVVNSYTNKDANYECDLLIVDEVHTVLTESAVYFNTTIQRTKFKYFIGLSATISEENKRVLKKFNLDTSEGITLHEGQSLGLVPNYLVVNCPIPIHPSVIDKYTKFYKLFEDKQMFFSPLEKKAFKVCMFLSGSKTETYYNKETGKFFSFKQILDSVAKTLDTPSKVVAKNAILWRVAMQNRDKLLNESFNLLHAGHEIIKALNGAKTLVFAPSIEAATKLQKLKADYVVYHSKQAKKLKSDILKSYRLDVFSTLIAVRALDQGEDIKGITYGINMFYSSKDRQFQQRLGRILRDEDDEGTHGDKTKVFFNLHHAPYLVTDTEKDTECIINPHDKDRLHFAQRGFTTINLKTYNEAIDYAQSLQIP